MDFHLSDALLMRCSSWWVASLRHGAEDPMGTLSSLEQKDPFCCLLLVVSTLESLPM